MATPESWYGEAERLRRITEPVLSLADAASEMLLWIDTYDDAMGHSYCAMQSGEYEEPCTCGFEEKRQRWVAAIRGTR